MVYTKSNLANIEASASSGTKASLSNKMQSIDSMKQLYEQSLAKFKEGSANSTMQEYVKQRGIDAERFGLCGSADGKMLLIPYQNKSNFYWIGRLLNPGEYKYYKPQGVKEPLFNETAFEWKSKDA